jgi:putative transposase
MPYQSYKYRLYPTRAQAAQLVTTLDRCRELYNAALQERRDAYQMARKSLTFAHQSAELPAVKEARPEYRAVYSQTLQDVLHRLDRAFGAFFRRVKAGEKPGYPRFQGQARYDSFTYVRHEVAPLSGRAWQRAIQPTPARVQRRFPIPTCVTGNGGVRS